MKWRILGSARPREDGRSFSGRNWDGETKSGVENVGSICGASTLGIVVRKEYIHEYIISEY